jgi:hypothetical protein
MDQKQALVTKLKEANNILVTVSSNPSVDQLAACIGLTLLLNKLKKHATAVFSGQVPSTLQFLKPEDTLEKNTDSLRDFIVSLDKSKADKLRYKVEDNVVKIFITPYKTSITEADLDFSQGDFNIDVVVCLGVDKQADLDQAITSHGRILHDATVASVSIKAGGELGTLNWVEPQASSLSELTAQIADALGREQLDGQIATAFLTGIVAETDRFRNEKTSPVTMQLSSQLMAAGANQQLVANELDGASTALAIDRPATSEDETKASADGTLEIGHDPENTDDTPPVESGDSPEPPKDGSGTDGQASSDPAGHTDDAPAEQPPAGPGQESPASRMMLQPPSMGGTLTANSTPESFDPSVDPLSLLNRDTPMLNRPEAATDDTGSQPASETTEPVAEDAALPEVKPADEQSAAEPAVELPSAPAETPIIPAADELPAFESLPTEPAPAQAGAPTTDVSTPGPVIDTGEKSLAELEEAVNSPHLQGAPADADAQSQPAAPAESLDAARDAVLDAVNSGPQNSLPQPTQAVGSEGYLNVQDLPGVADEAAPQDLTIPAPDPTPPTSVVEPASTAPPVPPPLPLDDLAKLTDPPKQ